MSDKAVADGLHGVLENREHVLWQGPIAFGITSHLVTVLIGCVLTVYAFQATWLSTSYQEFCTVSASKSCAGRYWLMPPLLLLMTVGSAFDWVERRAVEAGGRYAALVLTDRRLIRVVDWPWRRVRSANYLAVAPWNWFSGVIVVGRYRSFIANTDDASTAMTLMNLQRNKAK